MVVIKGIGIISPLGHGKAGNLAKMKETRSAIKRAPALSRDMPMAKAGHFFVPLDIASMPRPVQFGYLAMKEAIEDAGLSQKEISSTETAFLFSCSKGDLSYLDKNIDKNFWENILPSGAASYLAKLFKLRGPRISIVSACATGGSIIARASQLLLEGKIKRVILGASEAPLIPILLAGYDRMGVISHSEMRPFDIARDGFVLGEGGVCLILENKGKGAGKVLGCSLGTGLGTPYRFDLQGDALAHCLKEVTIKRNFFPDCINSHGTATPFGDLYETMQIKKAFGKDACKIPVCSTKSMSGHLLGVSGLLEFVLTLLCLKQGFIPAICGLRERDPECDLNYAINKPIFGSFHKFLIASYGFGGGVACIAGEV